jgi:hypothetical protein
MEKRAFDKVAECCDLKPGRVKLAQDVTIAIMSAGKLNNDMNVLIVQANELI